MNDDYLWDKSGEPDSEVEHLERLLGKFQYQPQPLDLPAITPRRKFSPALAVAAAVALIAVGLGVWLSWYSRAKETTPSVTASVTPAPEKKEVKQHEQVAATPRDEPTVQETQIAKNPKTNHRFTRHEFGNRQSPLAPARLTEEEKAKAQLMFALQITSSKLNLAQKRMQEGAPKTPRS